MNETDGMTALTALLITAAVVAAVFAVLGVVYGVVWLLILKDKRFDPARYERFRILHNLRKGARKR